MSESSFISASILDDPVRSFSQTDVVAKLWMIRNQLGRRNLLPAVRVQLALMLKPVLKEMAKANEVAGGEKLQGKKGSMKSSNHIHVRAEIAEAAGVSRKTVDHFETVMKDGDESTKAEMLAGKKKIDAASPRKPPVSANVPTTPAS